MFAQSYDPLSYEQLSPGSNSNKLMQEEMARRHRRLLSQAHQHRRRAKLDRMRRMEEEILLEEEQRRLEARQWAESIGAAPSSSSPRHDDNKHLQQHDLDASMLGTSFPPPYIYASVSSDDIMDVPKVHPHLPNIHLSPLRRQPSGHSATTIHRQNESWPDIPIPCPTNSCGNRALLHCEEQRQDSEDTTTKNTGIDEEEHDDDDDDDDDVATFTPPPPHIIAQHKLEEEDDNDDEDEDDDLNCIWNQVSQDSWELGT